MVKAYYKNSKGEVLWLTKAPFKAVESDWFDSSWEDSTDGYEKTVSIDVFGKREEFTSNMEKLYRVISYDSEVGALGRLYVNDTFLPCQIIRTSRVSYRTETCCICTYIQMEALRRRNITRELTRSRKSMKIHQQKRTS